MPKIAWLRTTVALLATLLAPPAWAAQTKDRYGATPIVAGEFNSYALHAGKLTGWGFDSDGRLATGLPAAAARNPTPVAGLPAAKAVAMGAAHTLVLAKDGTVWAFGANDQGQLGDGSIAFATAPTKILMLSNIVAIAAGGGSSFAVTASGTVYAWGRNVRGNLGLGTTTPTRTPTPITGLTNIRMIAAGPDHTLAQDAAGALWAWGYNASGQLGNNTVTTRLTPGRVSTLTGLTGATSLSAGASHSVALDANGYMWTWGANTRGQLCNSLIATSVRVPTIASGPALAAADAGLEFTLMLDSGGQVLGCGLNTSGQLGDGSNVNQRERVMARMNESIAAISAGRNHALAAGINGQLYAWGINPDGRLGTGSNSSTPALSARVTYTFPYKTLVLLAQGTSVTQDLTSVNSRIAKLAADMRRESFGRVQVQMEIAGPYVGSPATIGCTWGDGDQRKVRDYAATKAAAAGFDLGDYAHFILWPSQDFWSGSTATSCQLANNHGTLSSPSEWNTAATWGAGMTYFTYGWSAQNPQLLLHEFLHSHGQRGIGHTSRLTCTGSVAYPPSAGSAFFNPGCIFGEDIASALDPQGAGVRDNDAWSDTTETPNAIAPHKAYFQWYGWDNVVYFPTTAPPGDWWYDIYANDASTTAAGQSHVIQIPLPAPNPNTSSYFIEYRAQAHLGKAPGHAATPGVFLTLGELNDDVLGAVIKIGNNANNSNGLTPLAINAKIQLTPKIWMQVQWINSASARVFLRVDP